MKVLGKIRIIRQGTWKSLGRWIRLCSAADLRGLLKIFVVFVTAAGSGPWWIIRYTTMFKI